MKAETCYQDYVKTSFYNKCAVDFKFFLSVDCFVTAVPIIICDVSDAQKATDFGMWFEFYSK